MLDAERSFNQSLIKLHPKSYWVWNFRRFLLEIHPKAPWEIELMLCRKLLDLDARNFHCWDYRRFLLSHINVQTSQTKEHTKSELEFTMQKIRQNFSNYSAWHVRSQLLNLLDTEEPVSNRIAVIQSELELIQAAYYTEPADQSAWLYHHWILGMIDSILCPFELAVFFDPECADSARLVLRFRELVEVL